MPAEAAICAWSGPAGVSRLRGWVSLKKCPWLGSSEASDGRMAMMP